MPCSTWARTTCGCGHCAATWLTVTLRATSARSSSKKRSAISTCPKARSLMRIQPAVRPRPTTSIRTSSLIRLTIVLSGTKNSTARQSRDRRALAVWTTARGSASGCKKSLAKATEGRSVRRFLEISTAWSH